MKHHFNLSLLMFLLLSTGIYSQNPNWTLPSQKFNPQTNLVQNLPTLPGSLPTEYQGGSSIGLHNSYSDNDGNILFFNVDEAVYDKTGYHVGDFQVNASEKKRGYNESLILPMGKSCTRFAFLYFGSLDYGFGGLENYNTDGRIGFFMSVYDLDATNPYDPAAIGSLDGMSSYVDYNSVLDISQRDGSDLTINPPGNTLFGYENYIIGSDTISSTGSYYKQFQIASSKLIDNCFYYVFVSDGENLIRYKLDETGLTYDGYKYDLGVSGTNLVNRTEMEMIELANGNYRIALPMADLSAPKYQIKIYDLNSSFNVVSTQAIDLGSDVNNINAFPIGLEFDATGRYLYFTHNPNINLPNVLEVWDVNSNSYATGVTMPAGISDYQYSYIERYGNKLYLAKSNKIGELSNISNPAYFSFNASAATITSGYGNNMVNNNPPAYPNNRVFRYILPDQIDDANYDDLADRTCDCCARFNPARDIVEVSTSATWTPSSNPLTSGGSDVYIRNELRIKAGTNLNIENMNFYFAPDAKVVVEKGGVSTYGAKLEIRNNTVFTADTRCSENNFASCGQFGEECDKDYWIGVIVEGDDALPQPPGSATKQGRFSMRTNAMIEYAHDAVLAEGGAVVEVQDSRIKDNYRGITFLPYIATSGMSEIFNRSFIRRTDFTATNDYFESKPSVYFVKTTSITGMYLSGNYFANFNTLLPNNCKGIYSINSRLVVGPDNSVEVQSEFLNLDYGFYGMNSVGNTRLVQLNYNLFTNNFIGVFLNNFINPIVLDNEFKVPAVSSATGLHLLGSRGYEVENNYFTTYNSFSFNQRNIGIYVEASGEYYNEIYRNFFTRLSFGGRVSKKNVDPGANNENELGLDWLCNEFDAPLHYSDISLTSSASMSDEQGDCTPEPAGNLFSHSSETWNPNHYDLFSEIGALSTIDYNYHGNDDIYPRLKPIKYSGQGGGIPEYLLQICTKEYGKDTCPVKRSGKPSWANEGQPGPKNLGESASFESIYEQASAFAMQIEEMQSADQDSEEQSDEMKALNAEVRAFWHDVTLFYQMDTLGVVTIDQMISLFNAFQPQSSDYFAAALMGNNTEEWFSDYVNYGSVEIAQPVMDDGILPTDIPEYFESDFFNNLGNLEALNAYYIENDSYYNPTVEMPDWSLFGETDELPDGNGEGKSMKGGKDTSAKIAVHPNPFKDNVTFDLKAYTFEGANNRLEFYDLLGKKVYELAINENQVNAIIQGSKLPEGIILFTLFVNNNPVENGKILRVK